MRSDIPVPGEVESAAEGRPLLTLSARPPSSPWEPVSTGHLQPPLPLAAAARHLRVARGRPGERTPPHGGHNREGLLHLRSALRAYVRSLEHLELPVASKLQHELRMLDTIDNPMSNR
jgi:hypothetical protein